MSLKGIYDKNYDANYWFDSTIKQEGWFDQEYSNATASGTTLAPASGGITVAGIVAALVFSLSPASGAIAVTGNAPSITKALAPTTASLVVAGQAPSLTAAFVATSGAVVVSGQTPGVSQALMLLPAEGSIVIGGGVPAVSQPAGINDVVQGGTHGPAHGPFDLYNYWRSQLGEEEEEKVTQALKEAAKAEIEIADAVNTDVDIARALESRRLAEEGYLEAHRSVLLEQYMEEAILARFKAEVALLRLEMNRRAALLLLLANS